MDKVVKIDSELLLQVEEFINLDENKFKYANRKQFIDLAVFEALKRGK
jgi:K+-sensing histidine kinase KdpD